LPALAAVSARQLAFQKGGQGPSGAGGSGPNRRRSQAAGTLVAADDRPKVLLGEANQVMAGGCLVAVDVVQLTGAGLVGVMGHQPEAILVTGQGRLEVVMPKVVSGRRSQLSFRRGSV